MVISTNGSREFSEWIVIETVDGADLFPCLPA